MIALYLDHNIVHYYVKGFPKKGWDSAIEVAALEDALHRSPDVRFVVSDWHAVEAARDCAGSPAPLALADRYATFLERLNPLYIGAHDALQRAELADHALALWGYPVRARPTDWMFARHFSQIQSLRVREVLIGYDVRAYIRHLATTPASLKLFNAPIQTARRAAETRIAAYRDGRHRNPSIRTQIEEAWFLSLLPERDPDERWIAQDKRKGLAAQLAGAPDEVLRACPTMAIESAGTNIRAAAGSRVPRDSDALDLMHVVPALAYRDVFVSNDAHLRTVAARAAAARAIVACGRPTESGAAATVTASH